MMKKKRANTRRKQTFSRLKLLKCGYCENKTSPDYKNYEDIGRFVSDRARIAGRDRSGLCAKHQRRLAVAIKRARHLGLLPFKIAI